MHHNPQNVSSVSYIEHLLKESNLKIQAGSSISNLYSYHDLEIEHLKLSSYAFHYDLAIDDNDLKVSEQ